MDKGFPDLALFEPNGFYSNERIQAMIGDKIQLRLFEQKLKIPRRFKHGLLGRDICNALHSPPEDSVINDREPAEEHSIDTIAGRTRQNPGIPPKSNGPMRSISKDEISGQGRE